MDIIKKISEELEVKSAQVQAAVDLLDEGCTVPFIARYERTFSIFERAVSRPEDGLSMILSLKPIHVPFINIIIDH